MYKFKEELFDEVCDDLESCENNLQRIKEELQDTKILPIYYGKVMCTEKNPMVELNKVLKIIDGIYD